MTKIEGTAEAWEAGQLGQDQHFTEIVEVEGLEIDQALGLKSISIRMPLDLIEGLKNIAEINGLGYQPLMKQVLTRFVEAEQRKALVEVARQVSTDKTTKDEQNEELQQACG